MIEQGRIDLKNPGHQIIDPRFANSGWWCDLPIARGYLRTPSYDDPYNWYLIIQEVRCTNPECPHSKEYVRVEKHCGLRKFAPKRLEAEKKKAQKHPELYIFKTI
jgi:hypothetical protein